MDIQLTQIDCYKCGMSFWISKQHDNQLLKSKNDFFCPNGHAQAYIGETDAVKLARANGEIAIRQMEIGRLQTELRKLNNKKCKKVKKNEK